MNNKKAKLLKKIVNTAEPNDRLLAKNMYRYVKRCYINGSMPVHVPEYINYYNGKIERKNHAIQEKYKKLIGEKDDASKDSRLLQRL